MGKPTQKMLRNPESVRYPKFPEFDETVPEVILINSSTIDQIRDINKITKRPMWRERSKGGRVGQVRTKNGWYPPEKRIEVATAFVAGMTNATHLEALTKIPSATIRDWKRQDWWADLIDRVRYEKDEELDPKFTKIIEKTLDRMENALTVGDDHVTKDGDIIKKMVSGRDASMIMKTATQQRQLLRGKPTSRIEQLSSKDQLSKLAAEFRKFSGAKTIEGSVIDAEEETKHDIPIDSGSGQEENRISDEAGEIITEVGS